MLHMNLGIATFDCTVWKIIHFEFVWPLHLQCYWIIIKKFFLTLDVGKREYTFKNRSMQNYQVIKFYFRFCHFGVDNHL